jgi:hypothetical protein
MLTLVLKNNNFTFDGNHYLQINGTAIGTKMTHSYANIFMEDIEETVLRMATTGGKVLMFVCGLRV